VPDCYRFGQIEVRRLERRVLVNGLEVGLGARAFDVLMALVTHRNRLVSKSELLDTVWPGLVVEENNLQVQVSSLRKMFGNHAVATVQGHGYRFTLTPDNIDAADQIVSTPSASKPKHNLPAPLTSFVGREREMRELKTLFATTRLLTLTSMGGTGKTRLSLEFGVDVASEYADGVWLVELAALTDARLVPAAVAAVLGVMEVAGRSVMEALEQFVKDRTLLLILDNCEHLVEASAMVAKKLLQAGASVKVLASSRERLQVLGEAVYQVPSLDVPTLHINKNTQPNEAGLSEEAIAKFSQCEAVRLWLDRSRAVAPQFQVSANNAASIADICHRLDGIPLAIELAAARMYTMTVDDIALALHDRFALLTKGDITALPRQQTLRASIEWSVELLSRDERMLLQKLSVFAGGFTLPAAQALVLDQSIDVTTHLIQLVEKSLVIKGSEGTRYRLLETVRQYADEQLQLQDDASDTKWQHLNFYLALASEARPQLAGAHQATWFAKLDAERENLLAAHTHAAGLAKGAELGLNLAWSLKPYWVTRGYLGLGLQLTLEALSHPGASERNLARCRGRCDAGLLCVLMGKNDMARLNLEESYAIALELGDLKRVAIALQPLGMAAMGQGDMEAAHTYLKEALQLATMIGNPREIAAANSVYAQFLRVVGELDAAEPLYAASLMIARDLQDQEYIAISLLNLAMVSIEREQSERVTAMLLEALTICNAIGSKRTGQSIVDVAIGLAALHQQWQHAARYIGVAATLVSVTGLARDPADEAFLAPRLTEIQAALVTEEYDEAVALGRALSYDEAMSTLASWLTSLNH
jgi:predicted ATPase/DNA-binding winged helix-turn-helix (wHTH) protein